jgi:4-hydroxybenzoate polyprenyltransferase
LGASADEDPWQPFHWLVACGVGAYVTGVTIFARTEARRSGRWQLALGLAVLLGGIGLLAWSPSWTTGVEWPEVRAPHNWYLLWGLIALWLGGRCALAVAEPTPRLVQGAVRSCIFGLVVLDAAAVLAVQPIVWAAAILMLLVPAMFLGRWIYST